MIHVGIVAFLRKHPQAVFPPYLVNVILYAWLLAHGARFVGIFISALTSAGVLGFIFLCIRAGFVIGGKGKIETAEQQSRAFWMSMVFAFAMYLVFTAGAIGFYLQDIERSKI